MLAMNLAEREKEHVREDFLKAEDDAKRDLKKKLVIDDFESLSIIGRFEIFIITHSNIKSFVLHYMTKWSIRRSPSRTNERSV
jgi:hypothetical protein